MHKRVKHIRAEVVIFVHEPLKIRGFHAVQDTVGFGGDKNRYRSKKRRVPEMWDPDMGKTDGLRAGKIQINFVFPLLCNIRKGADSGM